MRRSKLLRMTSFVILIITGCQPPETKTINLDQLMVTKDGYFIKYKEDGSLHSIIRHGKEDTLKIYFDSLKIVTSLFDKNSGLKNYFISFRKGLYQIDEENMSYPHIKQDHIICIDTTVPTFMIKERSDMLSIIGLRDTVNVGDKLILHINTYDSLMPQFKAYINSPYGELSTDIKQAVKIKSFYQTTGFTDTLVFKKKGMYYYQGFVENYKVLDNKSRATVSDYFKKGIYVR